MQTNYKFTIKCISSLRRTIENAKFFHAKCNCFLFSLAVVFLYSGKVFVFYLHAGIDKKKKTYNNRSQNNLTDTQQI